MSHGYAEEGDAFFRDWGLEDVPADFSFLRWLSDEKGEPVIVSKLGGMDRACEIGDRFRADPAALREIVSTLRRAYWWVRNERCGGSAARSEQAKSSVLDCCCLLELGGVTPRDIVVLCRCHSHRCICDGCDVFYGDRFCKPA